MVLVFFEGFRAGKFFFLKGEGLLTVDFFLKGDGLLTVEAGDEVYLYIFWSSFNVLVVNKFTSLFMCVSGH